MAGPSFPPLYFDNQSSKDDDSSSSVTSLLPAELLQRCFTESADWGDLARLANVSKTFCGVLYDAGNRNNESKWELAQALLHGTTGLAENSTQAMKLLLELANMPLDDDNNPLLESTNTTTKCFAPAMKQIAMCYLTGKGVETANADLGLEWFKASHEQGHDVDAAHELALVYENGQYGVPVDVVEAVHWFQKAADAGHVEAMVELGYCYELGLTVEQSDEQALEWYMKAAEQGHLTAKFSVGEAFEQARGVPQSDAEACLWYYKAAIEGDEDSRKALRRLENIARIVLPGVGNLLDA